jgi:hypothetical protein
MTDDELRERRLADADLQQRLKVAREEVAKAMSEPDDLPGVTAEELPAFLREFT